MLPPGRAIFMRRLKNKITAREKRQRDKAARKAAKMERKAEEKKLKRDRKAQVSRQCFMILHFSAKEVWSTDRIGCSLHGFIARFAWE